MRYEQDLYCCRCFTNLPELGSNYHLPNETLQHMFVALQSQELYANRVRDVGEIRKVPI